MRLVFGFVIAAVAACSTAPSGGRSARVSEPFFQRAERLLYAETFDDRPAVLELYRDGCAAGELRSCRVAINLAEHEIGEHTLRRATKLLSGACLGGDRPSCQALRAGTRRYDSAVEVQSLCDRGLAIACTDAIQYTDPTLDSDDDVPPRPETVALYERGCRLGEPWGCTAMALFARKIAGREGEKAHWQTASKAAARVLCSDGYAFACLELGDEGRPAFATLTFAACTAGEIWPCVDLLPDPVGNDQLRVAEAACRLEPYWCYRTALAYRAATPPDPRAARAAFARACAYPHRHDAGERVDACAQAGMPPPR